MSDDRIRILAVAPYESMKNALLHAAEGFKNLDLTVRIGDLEEGAAVVRALSAEEPFDAIVSRGCTADL
ncbi:MAG: PrpR N-terminal domain-containing protein, partial [Kiritimatiellae bacterium]|nr:PrpR N-terminal domain-containing protein [Kiritimatiellia bacterium]